MPKVEDPIDEEHYTVGKIPRWRNRRIKDGTIEEYSFLWEDSPISEANWILENKTHNPALLAKEQVQEPVEQEV